MIEFVKTYLGALFSTLFMMGSIYLLVWIIFGNLLKNRKIQLSKRAGWSQIKDEILHSALAILGSTAFSMIIFSLNKLGKTLIYTDAGKYGIAYEIISGIVMILISDTWFYWLHRWMHHPKAYKYVHALHHKSLDVNPFTSNSFHVLEAIGLTIWVLPLVLFMPISTSTLGVVQAVGTFNNLKSHLGYEFFPKLFRIPPFNMLITATNHSLHHTQYNGNYGLFFRFWDIICGTELAMTQQLFEEIHERRNERVQDNTHYRPLTIKNIVKETSDTVSVYFKPTDEAFYNYFAGQHLTLRVNIKGKTHQRCFSLSSSPQIDDFLRITVKLKGEVSHYFYYNAQVGESIESLLPVGDIVLKSSPTASKNYVMKAGGSGITPLYSMIRQVLWFEPQSHVWLFYANKTENNIIFKNELTELAQSNPHFQYIDFISDKKRINKETLSTFSDATFYICGPDSLKNEMNAYLKENKIDKSRINIEHYADGYVSWFGLM